MSKRIWDEFLTEKDKRIYQLSGYGKRGGFGTRPALFIIDVQYNFCGDRLGETHEEGLKKYRTHCGEAGWKAVPHIERLMDLSRQKNLPIFYTQSERRPDMLDSGVQVAKSHRGGEKISTEGTHPTQTVAPLAPRQQDILIGTPIANRNFHEIEGLIGFFVNTVVLRNRLEGNPSFTELLSRTKHMTLEAYDNQDFPFEHSKQ